MYKWTQTDSENQDHVTRWEMKKYKKNQVLCYTRSFISFICGEDSMSTLSNDIVSTALTTVLILFPACNLNIT